MMFIVGLLLVVFNISSMSVVIGEGALRRNCQYSEFYDNDSQKCRPCSQCPTGQLVQRSCDRNSDTVCGNYVDLDGVRLVVLSETSAKNISYNSNGGGPRSGSSSASPDLNLSVQTDAENWRVLAYGLIGLLCVVSVALTFIVISCYVMHRRQQPVRKDTEQAMMVTFFSDYANPYDATTATVTPTTTTTTNSTTALCPRPRKWVVASLIEEEEDEDEDDDDDAGGGGDADTVHNILISKQTCT